MCARDSPSSATDRSVRSARRSINASACPNGHARRDWALGMKFVIELPDPTTASRRVRGEQSAPLQPGTVWHTFGYPEPEIFGFLYVHPDRLVSVGIFVPSWMGDPSRTAYRYLQHYIQHPALWSYLKDGTLRSWGAKSLEESGRRGEPFLAGDGYARIGEGSGCTNMLTGSGVDEAWTTGVQLAEAVLELLRAGKAFTNRISPTPTWRGGATAGSRRAAREAENARNGFHGGIVRGLIGMALAGLTGGKLLSNRSSSPPTGRSPAPRCAMEDIERKTSRPTCVLKMGVRSTMCCSPRAAGPRFPSTAACSSPSRMRC